MVGRLKHAAFVAAWIFCSVSMGMAAPPDQGGAAAAEKAIATFKTPPGMQVQLFAAEPQLGNPVAISLDERGRVFIAEEYRFNRGTEENRTRPFTLNDDLQIRTLADRLAVYRKFADRFDGGMNWFSRWSDQVRLVTDTDGDGRADQSTIFADGFNQPLDGLAAGVLAREGDVYLTCIPHLWLLRDEDGDGQAEIRRSLHEGFGVNLAFLGHDLHGLVFGPDGRLYFSVGDRGYQVTTHEGRVLAGPRNGAVFRCWPDGSELEVVHRGLRNPQELAFDEYGNLFADDNNCDKGDKARLVYIVPGGNSGWNMSYQTIPAPYLTGPWHAEKMWHLPHAGQPAWIVPPVGHIGTGPSGFAYYPGLGLDERYRGHFFMCNYTTNGGIESFAVRPVGAGFEIVDYHDFFKPVRTTDCEFGYDGKLYVSEFPQIDWSGGDNGGRIYSLFRPDLLDDPAIRQVATLMGEGFANRSVSELASLLEHADMRVRQRAQFALAKRGPEGAAVLTKLLTADHPRLVRLHAIWGLGQIARRHRDAINPVAALLSDADAEVRAQAASVLGDLRWKAAGEALAKLLADDEPRVRMFAALALGNLGHKLALAPLVEMLRANADADPFLRHAGVMGLVGMNDADAVLAYADDASPAVRMAVLLVLRQREDPRLARFLDDPEPALVAEAARAINDLPLDEATTDLAGHLSRSRKTAEDDPLTRRALNAQFRLGEGENLQAVAAVVADSQYPLAMRQEALAMLADWERPGPRDRVTGFWRPLPPRDKERIKAALEPQVPQLLATASGPLQPMLIELITKLEMAADDETFVRWAGARSAPVQTRIQSLRRLSASGSGKLRGVVETTLVDPEPAVRAEARSLLATSDPVRAAALLSAVLSDAKAPLAERQSAAQTLASLPAEQAQPALAPWGERLLAGKVPAALELEVLDALSRRSEPALAQAAERFRAELAAQGNPLERYRSALFGGDAERGRAIFQSHAAAQCMRCHRIRGEGGGVAGPDLTQVAKRGDRNYLLQSLLDPNAKIAQGFATVTLVLESGKILAGTIKEENDERLVLDTPTGERVTIRVDEVDERAAPKSLMPAIEVDKILTLRELRDLVEFLTTLQ